MRKSYTKFLTVLLLIFTNFLFAQQRNLWSRIDRAKIGNSEIQRKVELKKYKTFELKMDVLSSALKSAPTKKSHVAKSFFKMDFPDKNGELSTYLIKEAPVMHPDLAKQFPNNKSYVGVGEKDKSKKIRFSVNEIGFHAILMEGSKIQYIDPLTKDKKTYKVYDRSEMKGENDFQCLSKDVLSQSKAGQGLVNPNDGKLRTYRLAMAATGEYSTFHIDDQGANGSSDDEKKDIVMAAITTAITRINAVYENDLAVTMQLVANNENIIYLDPDTDPYTVDQDDPIVDFLTQNQNNVENVIGSSNYDIGHLFSTIDGGVATFRSTCNNSIKARGYTGSPTPLGENFYFDYVAHEMGHQFGANHSFNGDEGSCSDPHRNDATAVEPGSGSTIMAYAGLCGSQNVQGQSDLYFHVISIEEIWTYVTVGNGTCATESDLTLNNNVPVADAGADFIIPIGTPYILKGNGSDGDNDPITFCWEQTDNEITILPPSGNAIAGALYRSVNPMVSPNRYLPNLNTLINGDTSSKWEVTPMVAREINFRLTVRDNNSEAGQVDSDDVLITVTDAAGPFIVTSQNVEEIVWTPNTQETITWDVAGTDGNGVDVSRVNILLSIDGGKTFSSSVATNVPNDGTQIIAVPDSKASKCFIMVEAIGNHFFAMNTKAFSIGAFNEVCNSYDANDTPVAIPDNDSNGVSSTISVPENVSIEKILVKLIDKSNPSVDNPGITHTFIGDLTISLESPEGTMVELFNGACDSHDDIEAIFSDDGIALVCSSPVAGKFKPVQELSVFNGENAQGNWTLKIVDNQADDIGFLEAWSLEICTSEAVLAVNNYVFEDFKVFPNPSNGYFTVEFRSENTGDVEISIYDLLGRKIAYHNYKNQFNKFNQDIDLLQVSGGIYILQVKRGNKMSFQKIRIN